MRDPALPGTRDTIARDYVRVAEDTAKLSSQENLSRLAPTIMAFDGLVVKFVDVPTIDIYSLAAFDCYDGSDIFPLIIAFKPYS